MAEYAAHVYAPFHNPVRPVSGTGRFGHGPVRLLRAERLHAQHPDRLYGDRPFFGVQCRNHAEPADGRSDHGLLRARARNAGERDRAQRGERGVRHSRHPLGQTHVHTYGSRGVAAGGGRGDSHTLPDGGEDRGKRGGGRVCPAGQRGSAHLPHLRPVRRGTVYALAVQLRAAGPGGLCGRGGQHAR